VNVRDHIINVNTVLVNTKSGDILRMLFDKDDMQRGFVVRKEFVDEKALIKYCGGCLRCFDN
jgi:hypothetical protein